MKFSSLNLFIEKLQIQTSKLINVIRLELESYKIQNDFRQDINRGQKLIYLASPIEFQIRLLCSTEELR